MPSGTVRGRVSRRVSRRVRGTIRKPVYEPVRDPARHRQALVCNRFTSHPPTVTVVLLNPSSAAQVRAPDSGIGSRLAMILPLITLTSS